jgi:GDP-4-dehydro-6-deoxy-D-mannose reductase
MKKYLITGAAGFVSKHLLNELNNLNEKYSIMALDIIDDPKYINYRNLEIQYLKINLLNYEWLEYLVLEFRPDYIVHLASISSVALSWQKPVESFMNNTNIFLNLLESVKNAKIKCRILSVGSSEEYGNVNPEDCPLKETHSLSPVSPYGVARVSQEMLSKIYSLGFGLDVIITRSFNHIGPGQKDIFVISSFVKQLVEIKKQKKKEAIIYTGDLSIIRDFLDVRDVVRAYLLLLEHGFRSEVYNICSGQGYSLSSILDIVEGILEIQVISQLDDTKVRPYDNRIIIGDNNKLKSQTNWNKEIALEQSIYDIIKYWEINT